LNEYINRFHLAGFLVISPDFVNIASMRDSHMGEKSELGGMK